ncbi:MAG: myxococcus cysteine-rich repeat containing protein [Deltaproteobacteria bacterium]
MKHHVSGVMLALTYLSWAAPAQAVTGYCDELFAVTCANLSKPGCEQRDGCYWVDPGVSNNPGCGGTPVACGYYGTNLTCAGQTGCIWHVVAECGDGRVDSPEECDDGNTASNDGCSADCLIECGNGNLEPNEECDDGNRNSFDGCSSTCEIELCGNGAMDPGEACDDGNRVSGDGCSRTCVIETANILQMSAAPRRLEWSLNARVAMTPGAKTVQISYPGRNHALTIRASDIKITGPHASHFSASPSSSIPFDIDRRNPLAIDVAYTGPTGSSLVAEATLKVEGHFFTETRSIQVSLRTDVFNPEIEAFPATVATFQDAPCGGFDSEDMWSSNGRAGLAVNSYPATQRVHAVAQLNASDGTIEAKPRDPAVSLPVDLAPGESLEYVLTWSGQGPVWDAQGEVELTVEDVQSGGYYTVTQEARYRQIEDCTTPRLEIANALNFGVSEVGVASTAQMPYFNLGSADLEITSIEDCDAPAQNATFGHLASLPITLAPTGYMGSQTLPFEVVPNQPGPHSTCLKVVTNDEVGEYEVELFTFTGNRKVQMVPELVELSPSSPTKTVLIMNVGALPIVIRQGTLVIDPAFTLSLQGQSYPVTLQGGELLPVTVSAVDFELDASGTLDLDTLPQDGLPVVGESVGLQFDAP